MRNFISIACLILVSGCIKEIPLNPGEKPYPSPVAFFFVQPDSVVNGTLARVSGIAEKDLVSDSAIVLVYRNGILLEALDFIGTGRYRGNFPVMRPRDTFTLECSGIDQPFSVNGIVPSAVVIGSVDTATLPVPGVGRVFVLDVQFTDSAVYENFYRFSVDLQYYRYKVIGNKRTDSVMVYEKLNISGSARPFIDNNFNSYTSYEILFSDATMNGTTPTFRLSTSRNLYESEEFRPLRLTLRLENLDKHLYNYYNTRNAHLWQQQSISQLPGLVTGNIPSGYGVIGAYTTDTYEILFP